MFFIFCALHNFSTLRTQVFSGMRMTENSQVVRSQTRRIDLNFICWLFLVTAANVEFYAGADPANDYTQLKDIKEDVQNKFLITIFNFIFAISIIASFN